MAQETNIRARRVHDHFFASRSRHERFQTRLLNADVVDDGYGCGRGNLKRHKICVIRTLNKVKRTPLLRWASKEGFSSAIERQAINLHKLQLGDVVHATDELGVNTDHSGLVHVLHEVGHLRRCVDEQLWDCGENAVVSSMLSLGDIRLRPMMFRIF